MKHFSFKKALAVCVFILSEIPLSIAAPSSYSISLMGGMSLIDGEVDSLYEGPSSFLFGGEFAYSFAPTFAAGVFIDFNSLTLKSDSTSGTAYFYGIFSRMSLDFHKNLFFDFKIGATNRSIGAPPPSSNTAFGLGMGVGYQFVALDWLAISPRFGYRYTPFDIDDPSIRKHESQDNFDFNLLFSFLF